MGWYFIYFFFLFNQTEKLKSTSMSSLKRTHRGSIYFIRVS